MSVTAKPMHIFCKIIGVAPYSFDSGSSTAKFKTSRLGLVHSSLITALLTLFAILNYQTIYFHLTSESYVTIGAQWLQFYVNNGFSVLLIIANSLQQWKIVKAFNVLFDTRNEVPQKILDHRELKKEIFCGTAIVVITIFLHLLTTLTSYFNNEKRVDYYWFAYGILFLLNSSVVLQFSYGVVEVGTKFKALNLRLEDCIGEGQLEIITKHNKTTEIVNMEVNKAAEEHLNLIDVTNILISAFSYQLFLCFVAALTISVSGLYLICKRIIQYTVDTAKLFDGTRENNYDWWCLTCYPLLHLILLGSLISVCSWTVHQTALLDAILPRFQGVFQNSVISSNINCFCQQLLLQRISFNVFHLFTISPSIICSIISTVLTYLIILVQFEISQDIGRTLQQDPLNSLSGGFNYSLFNGVLLSAYDASNYSNFE